MERTEIKDKLVQIISEQLGQSTENITETASFIEDLNSDSLDTVELVMAFEEEFELEIRDEDAEKILTLGDAIAYVDNALNQ